MPTTLNRRRSFVLGLLAAGGLAVGGAAGLSSIANAQTAPAPPAVGADAQGEANEAPGTEVANETGPETGNEAEDANDAADPKPADVKLDATQASAAATGAVPGTAGTPELEDEDGTAVWGVEVTKADGSNVDVKVDANTGTVLKQEAGDSGSEAVG